MIDLADEAVQRALLGRRTLKILRTSDRRGLRGTRVLITGAGGTLGCALAKQVAACEPEQLTLLDQCEYNLVRIERAILEEWPRAPVAAVLGDVSKAWSIGNACRVARPTVIYHAAAYKHVTMAERAVCSAIETNVLGTLATLEAAREVGARFVLVSSDKAAAPHGVMGATKRLAELTTMAAAGSECRPVVVRFGNVLGSSGSVLEIVLDRIRRELPVEVTDLEASRFFMTAEEAAALLMRADLLGRAGQIYWLDIGQPVKIVDLVMRVMVLAERAGFARVPIEVVGLHPGEKLTEDLHDQGLEPCPTTHRRIVAARQPWFDRRTIERGLRALKHDVAVGDASAALETLVETVPGFRPSPHAVETAAAHTIGRALRPVERPAVHRIA